MKRAAQIASAMVLAVMLFVTLSVILPVESQAKSVIVAVEGATFNVAVSINDNMKTYIGKDVVIHLRSGKTFQGYVKTVGEHFVHVEKLSGRDLYDALIRIEDISAIETKFRDIK